MDSIFNIFGVSQFSENILLQRMEFPIRVAIQNILYTPGTYKPLNKMVIFFLKSIYYYNK